MEENKIALTEKNEAALPCINADMDSEPVVDCPDEYPDDDDIRARILELQLQMEAEWEASGRLSAEEEEYARQADEELLYRDRAQDVIDSYQARRKLLTASPIRYWRDTMYDNFQPPEMSFWDRHGDSIITAVLALISFALQGCIFYYYFTH